jgi:hypothetical protein
MTRKIAAAERADTPTDGLTTNQVELGLYGQGRSRSTSRPSWRLCGGNGEIRYARAQIPISNVVLFLSQFQRQKKQPPRRLKD